mmetsp:Transcript_10968/g.22146  ORF Transcript_10968/g.22146 Transcript_10968/m.22146 type:complete len:88 (-) Transcript_10968:1833-2096(-)
MPGIFIAKHSRVLPLKSCRYIEPPQKKAVLSLVLAEAINAKVCMPRSATFFHVLEHTLSSRTVEYHVEKTLGPLLRSPFFFQRGFRI